MFECARRDANVPVKITWGALLELVEEGEIGGVYLSEVNVDAIKEVASITKSVAGEVELSLWSTLTNGIAKVCAELKVPIVACVFLSIKFILVPNTDSHNSYPPIGRRMLTGQFKNIPEGGIRQELPRFQPKTVEVNVELVKELEQTVK